jgi:tetratricopeptide (TPR) repeat protein
MTTETGLRRARAGLCALLLAGLALALPAGGCSAPSGKPKALPELRRHLLEKAKQKFRHALRITEQHSPDPFNQAREQLVYTLIELEEFEEAEETGRKFVDQKLDYIEAARAKLAEVELDWRKEVLASPEIEGTRRETVFREAQREWKLRVQSAERQVIGLSMLVGEVLLRRKKYRDSISLFKRVLEIRPDHNAALRRIGQAFVHLENHSLAASYLEKAYNGIEERIRRLRNDEPAEPPPPEEPASPEETRIPRVDVQPERSLEQRLEILQNARIEIASVVAMLHFLGGRHPLAMDWFNRAFEIDPTCVFLDLKTGLSALVRKRYKEGLAKLRAFRLNYGGQENSMVILLLDRIENAYFKK